MGRLRPPRQMRNRSHDVCATWLESCYYQAHGSAGVQVSTRLHFPRYEAHFLCQHVNVFKTYFHFEHGQDNSTAQMLN